MIQTKAFSCMSDPDPEVLAAPPKRRQQARAIETRERFLAAASAEFAQRGFEGATTRSIAQRAGIGHNLLIYHFETKVGLWQEVMRRAIGRVKEAHQERLNGLRGVDPVTQLRLIQADFIMMAAEHPELHWLMSHEAGQRGERIDWIIDNLVGTYFEQWKDLIVAAQDAGGYVPGDPHHLHYLFIGAAARIFMLSAEVEKIVGQSPFDPDFVRRHVELCQSLFFTKQDSGPERQAEPRRTRKAKR
jgi:AcrR family transcriptional regulator